MNRTKAWAWVKGVVIVFFIAVGIFFLFKDFAALSQAIKSLDYKYFMGACMLAAAANVMSAYKLSKTFQYTMDQSVHFPEWLSVCVKSYLLNTIFPLSGLMYRGNYFKKKFDLPYTDFIGITYVFALSGVIVLLCLASIFLAMHDQAFFLAFFSVTLVLAIIAKLSILHFLTQFRFKGSRINFYLQKLSVFGDMTSIIYRKHKIFKYLALFTFGACIDFLVFISVFYGFRYQIAFDSLVYIYLAYSLSWIVRITPGNIGIQEMIISMAGLLVGFGGLNGALLSLLLRLVNFVGVILLWCGLWLYLRLEKK